MVHGICLENYPFHPILLSIGFGSGSNAFCFVLFLFCCFFLISSVSVIMYRFSFLVDFLEEQTLGFVDSFYCLFVDNWLISVLNLTISCSLLLLNMFASICSRCAVQ